MERTKEQEILVCLRLMDKLYRHIAQSYAELATDLHQLQREAEGTAQQPSIAQMNQCLLHTLGKQYMELVEIAFQQLLACLQQEAVQGRLPFTEEDETDALPF
jgi:hypothetical protein